MLEGHAMASSVMRFEDVEIDLRLREVRRGAAVAVRLQEQPFQLLALMLDRPGDVVTREDIRLRLWPDGTSVDFEHSVNAAIKRLRAALGDEAGKPRFVETIPRRGYRFIGHLGETGAAPSGAPRPRLVVLPFVNLTADPAFDHFSDGLTEELIAQLGQRCADRVGVLARTSAMLYKDARRGAADIGEALRVDHLVEGSVRGAGGRVRVTAQLIETRGETHLWAQSYDRDLADGLLVQTAVATEMALAVLGEIMPAPPRTPVTTPVHAAGAYEAYLTGRFHWHRSGSVGLTTAIEHYGHAIAADPGFGRAYSSRARALLSLTEYYALDVVEALRSARDDAERALTIDGDDCDAWIVVGEARRTLDRDPDGARAAYLKALAINPNNEAAHRYNAWFLGTRQPGVEAMEAADRAFNIDPLCIAMQTAAADVRFLGRDFEGALARSRHVLAMDPGFERGLRIAAAALVAMGRADEAVALFDPVPERDLCPASLAVRAAAFAAAGSTDRARAVQRKLSRAASHASPYHLAVLHLALGDCQAAVDALANAIERRDPWIDAMGVDPRFTGLHGDPRFEALRTQLHLP
jgi:TolB-like protein/tetratricopeptide (TPR) repeat protein